MVISAKGWGLSLAVPTGYDCPPERSQRSTMRVVRDGRKPVDGERQKASDGRRFAVVVVAFLSYEMYLQV